MTLKHSNRRSTNSRMLTIRVFCDRRYRLCNTQQTHINHIEETYWCYYGYNLYDVGSLLGLVFINEFEDVSTAPFF